MIDASRFPEDYATLGQGEPAGAVFTVNRNADGQAQRPVVNHRPRSRCCSEPNLLGAKVAGTPIVEIFSSASAVAS